LFHQQDININDPDSKMKTLIRQLLRLIVLVIKD